MSNKRRHIVIDTNVLLSAGLLPNSVTANALAVALEHFVLAQNQATWHELQTRIARPKFDRYFGALGRLSHLTQLAQSAEFFEVSAVVAASRDADDNKFLALATDAQAQIIVTGDQDLLVLHPFQGIDICTPAQFLVQYPSGRALK
jgi:putative PIN family toxin of toxin-antitoxin system